jgi:hypothetical protein
MPVLCNITDMPNFPIYDKKIRFQVQNKNNKEKKGANNTSNSAPSKSPTSNCYFSLSCASKFKNHNSIAY